MKRLFKFAVFALALLAAVQPLLADAACAQPRCERSPDCSMRLDSMVIPDSAAQSLLASSQATPQVVFAGAGSSGASCRPQSSSATSLMATPPIVKLASSSTFLMPVVRFFASRAVILAARSSEDAAAGAIPKHVLFQVFRI
jgi:hypothetical protein